jgi:thiosulfate/3-mercaptopyruvate sulfurtransferase
MEHLIEPLLLKKYMAERQNLVIVDVRWYPKAEGKGLKEWESGRIPGAVFLDLDNDLSDRSNKKSGRHPLPDPYVFANMLNEKGIGKDSIIVAYDDAAGSIAARLWWMMKWIKGPETKILDGGIQAWQSLGLPLESGPAQDIQKKVAVPVIPEPQNQMFVNLASLKKELADGEIILLDARDEARYLGKSEPIDPVAGHIPGALNSSYKKSLTGNDFSVFQNPETLRKNFAGLGIESGSKVISYCGSGVTACHNILAMEIAGLSGARLYPGSWSEWCQNL